MTVYAHSDVGRARTNNEDAFAVTDLGTGAQIQGGDEVTELNVSDRGILMTVSDGMGGAAFGEVASALVVDSLGRSMGEQIADSASIKGLIEAAVTRANTDVFQAAKSSEKQGMGATLTAVLVHKKEAYLAAVGDSRAYLLRRGRLRQMTRDQSYVQLLVDHGLVNAKEAKNLPIRNMVLQALGVAETVEVSIGQLQLRRGDRLLLCSDGLHNALEDDELHTILDTCDPKTACHRMIELANERGGEDNLTAVVAHMEGDDLPFARGDESVTQTFEVLKDFFPEGVPRSPGESGPSDSSDDDDTNSAKNSEAKTAAEKLIAADNAKNVKAPHAKAKSKAPAPVHTWPMVAGLVAAIVVAGVIWALVWLRN